MMKMLDSLPVPQKKKKKNEKMLDLTRHGKRTCWVKFGSGLWVKTGHFLNG